jgi:hypothetical protein
MSLITKDDYEDIMNAMVTTIQSNINNQLGKIVEEIETIKERLSSFEVDKETKDVSFLQYLLYHLVIPVTVVMLNSFEK